MFYWPFVNLLVFRFVVLDSRAIANSFAGVLWNIFLSYQANRDAELAVGARGAEADDAVVAATAPSGCEQSV